MLRKIIPDVINDQVLVHLTRTATVREAARLMREHNVASVLVMEGGSLLGIFTERDMVQRVVAEGREPESTPLGQVMTPDPDTISADEKGNVVFVRQLWLVTREYRATNHQQANCGHGARSVANARSGDRNDSEAGPARRLVRDMQV